MSYTRRTVVSVQVVDVQKRRKPTKHYVYVMNVSWSEGSQFSIYRSYGMLLEFQAKIQDLHPGHLPSLPGRFVFGRGAVLAEKRKAGVDEFCKTLIRLSPSLVESEDFLSFFEAWPEDVTVQFDFDSNLQSNAFYVSADAPRKSAGEHIVGDKTDEVEPYRAVATWEARSRREISFVSGDRVDVIEKNVNGWWVVGCGNSEGVAPASYLEPLNQRPEDDRPEEDPYQGLYMVCIDFRARSHDEISLEGDTAVDILETNLDGWWRVRANGKEGLFPSTFLKKMSVRKHSKERKSPAEEEAAYGVLVNPPPRREEIDQVDSIYSSIASLKRIPQTTSSAASGSSSLEGVYQYVSHGSASAPRPRFGDRGGGSGFSGGNSHDSDSDSDIFEYAEFAPTGQDDSPQYSEIGSVAPAEAAQQRKKIKERMASIREDSSRSAQKPEHKPQRLIRNKATRRPPQAEAVMAMEPKRGDFGESRSLSIDSLGSGSGRSEEDVDLYQVISAYRSQEESLSLAQGDLVCVDDIEDGWAFVRLVQRDKQKPDFSECQEGWAPAAYLQRCPKRKPKPNRPAPTLPGESGPPAQKAPQRGGDDFQRHKPPRSDSGPLFVHQQQPPAHPKLHATRSNDDRITITTGQPEPSVYVNTQPYVNVSTGGMKESTGPQRIEQRVDSRDSHDSRADSIASTCGDDHNYVNTGPVATSAAHSGSKTPYLNVGGGGDDDGELGSQYQALCDYHTMAPGCLSFSEGDVALLLQVKGQGWWKVKLNGQAGWVPSSYFEKELMLPGGASAMSTSRSMNSIPPPQHPSPSPSPVPPLSASMQRGSVASISSTTSRQGRGDRTSFLDLPGGGTSGGRASPSGRSPSPIRRSGSSATVNPQILKEIHKNISSQAWFHGKLSRREAEELMTRDGNSGDFIIRESANRIGDFALTVVYSARVRHFPVEVTIEGKVLIGKHRFESLNKIIQHYKECPLFIQDGAHISLGQPFRKRR